MSATDPIKHSLRDAGVTAPSPADLAAVSALARKCDEYRERVERIAPEMRLDYLKGCLAEVSQELTIFHDRYAPFSA